MSLFTLLFFGICLTFVILIYEVYSNQNNKKSKGELNQIQESKHTKVMKAFKGVSEEIQVMEIIRIRRNGIENFGIQHKFNVIKHLLIATIEAIEDMRNE